MNNKTLNTRIQQKYDTSTNWAAHSSIVLLAGEIGVESDTRLVKIGDGVSTWAELEYINDVQFGLAVDKEDSECLILSRI